MEANPKRKTKCVLTQAPTQIDKDDLELRHMLTETGVEFLAENAAEGDELSRELLAALADDLKEAVKAVESGHEIPEPCARSKSVLSRYGL